MDVASDVQERVMRRRRVAGGGTHRQGMSSLVHRPCAHMHTTPELQPRAPAMRMPSLRLAHIAQKLVNSVKSTDCAKETDPIGRISPEPQVIRAGRQDDRNG